MWQELHDKWHRTHDEVDCVPVSTWSRVSNAPPVQFQARVSVPFTHSHDLDLIERNIQARFQPSDRERIVASPLDGFLQHLTTQFGVDFSAYASILLDLGVESVSELVDSQCPLTSSELAAAGLPLPHATDLLAFAAAFKSPLMGLLYAVLADCDHPAYLLKLHVIGVDSVVELQSFQPDELVLGCGITLETATRLLEAANDPQILSVASDPLILGTNAPAAPTGLIRSTSHVFRQQECRSVLFERTSDHVIITGPPASVMRAAQLLEQSTSPLVLTFTESQPRERLLHQRLFDTGFLAQECIHLNLHLDAIVREDYVRIVVHGNQIQQGELLRRINNVHVSGDFMQLIPVPSNIARLFDGVGFGAVQLKRLHTEHKDSIAVVRYNSTQKAVELVLRDPSQRSRFKPYILDIFASLGGDLVQPQSSSQCVNCFGPPFFALKICGACAHGCMETAGKLR
jgi:hypothetical protein